MQKIDGQHHGVKLSPQETVMIRYWIETGAAYPGTYAALLWYSPRVVWFGVAYLLAQSGVTLLVLNISGCVPQL